MLAQIELNHTHAEAIESISKETGIEQKVLVTQAIDEFIKQQMICNRLAEIIFLKFFKEVD